ncbi:MAG: hypothetical protein M1833_007001 [Piccolia ochrophora]|nr:MAG: hypothetical protein M1833_007001 [Piccolia ochrophora]
MHPLLLITLVANTAQGVVVPRQISGKQTIPDNPKAPGTFFKVGVARRLTMPKEVHDSIPPVYQPRDIDLPFARMFHGDLNFYPTSNHGHIEDTPDNEGKWGAQYDNATSRLVAFRTMPFISPKLLKVDVGLCMQDLCISFWREDFKPDMLLKVTDVCTSDSDDGVPCATPHDIKIDRIKAEILYGLEKPQQGNKYPEKANHEQGSCARSIRKKRQLVYGALPPNNKELAMNYTRVQYHNNQKSYPANGWSKYEQGAYNDFTKTLNDLAENWNPGKEPCFTPIAGGESTARKGGSCPGSKQPTTSEGTTVKSGTPGNISSTNVKNQSTTENSPTNGDNAQHHSTTEDTPTNVDSGSSTEPSPTNGEDEAYDEYLADGEL